MNRWRLILTSVLLSLAVFASSPASVGTAGNTGGFGLTTARGNTISASSSSRFVCAITADARVKCWGYNIFGQLGLGDTNNRGDAAGEMGDNLPTVNLGTGRTATSVSTSSSYVCALLDNGTVKCWGNNAFGQLGLGDTNNRGDAAGEMGDNLPTVNLGTGRTAIAISSGNGHTCAILDNGTVKCWGYNNYGQLGLGDTNNRGDAAGEMGDNLPTVNLGTGRTAVSISAGAFHMCALLDNSALKCWGFNGQGQLGLGDTNNRGDGANEMGDNLPTIDLGTGRTAVSISAYLHTCAVLDTGSLKCWGFNNYGQLGLGNTNDRGDAAGEMGDNLPTVDVGANTTSVSAGDATTCAVLVSGSLKCWGRNDFGQLGLGDANARGDGAGEMGSSLPSVYLGASRTARAVSTGFEFTCAVLDDQSLKCWGRNGLGELGNGTLEGGVIGDHAIGDGSGEMSALTAVDITSTFNAARVVPGDDESNFSCAIDTRGRVKCWGRNALGQLGIGAFDDRGDGASEMGNNLPYVDLGTGRTATSLAAGNAHACAILDNGRIKCWGNNVYGQLGLGDTIDRSDGPGEMGDNLPYVELGTGRSAVAISSGYDHVCAILDNGRVKCWGFNNRGQLGLGGTTTRGTVASDMGDNLPYVELGTGRTATTISAGDYHTCVILDNSTMKCWGFNDYGQLGIGNIDYRGDQVGEMGDSLAAVDLGTGRTATAIASGNGYTCAILDNGTVKCWGRNNFGQLGRDSLSDLLPLGDGAGEMGTNLLAVTLGASRTARAIDANGYVTCALLDNSTIKCWGRGNNGILGTGDTVTRGDNSGEMTSLGAINLGTAVVPATVAVGSNHVCMTNTEGRVKCWGYNNRGQLGLGDIAARGDQANEMGDNLPFVSLGSTTGILTATGRPLAPNTLSGTPGLTSFSLAWTVPSDNGGSAITGYRIDRSTDGRTWTTVTANTGSTATSALAGSLSPSTQYYFRVAAINGVGIGAGSTTFVSSTQAPTPAFVPFRPARIINTRPTGKIGNRTGTADPMVFNVYNQGGLPASGIGAVLLNVTVVDPEVGDEGGYVTVYPCASGRPDASNLNFVTGQIIPNTVIAPVDPSGNICFYSYGKTHILADVSGYFPTGSSLTTLRPARIINTRPTGKIGNRTGTADPMVFNVYNQGGLPASGIGAVLLNVTVVDPEVGDEGGYVTVYPCASGRPDASNLNFVTGQIIPNTVIAPVDPSGNICFYSYGKTHILADVSGYFPTGSSLTTLRPARIINTRPTGKIGNRTGTADPMVFNVYNQGGLPASGIGAVLLNVTVVDPEVGDEGGYVTVYPCASGRPDASNLNFVTGQIIPNTVIAPVDPSGNICFYSYGKTHILADVNGYFPAISPT